MLSKLRCNTHFWCSANHITWSRLLIQIHIQMTNSADPDQLASEEAWGWSDVAKVLCILRHWGIQLILAYNWARLANLVAGRGRGETFLFLLFFPFHSCSSFFPVPLFHLLYYMYLFYLFSLSLGDDTKWPTRVDVLLNRTTIKILKMPTDLDLHCLQRQGVSRFSKTRVSHKYSIRERFHGTSVCLKSDGI